MAAVDFNRPVTLQAGASQAAGNPHKAALSIEDFFQKFYGTNPEAPHSSKFKPDAKTWSEYTLRVTMPDLKSKTSLRAKGKGKADIVPPEPSSSSAPATSSSSKRDTLPVGLLFPGQGSQYVKMMAGVANMPAVQQMLAKAKEILGFDVLKLCTEGPETSLEETRYCQPVMFIAGLAGLEKLKADRPEVAAKFQATAGLSLGEYTALCAAGVFTFEEGLRLVQLRGKAMQDAASMSKQSMLSVAGLEKEVLQKLCAEAVKADPGGCCQIANELFPKGFACAGTEKAVQTLEVLATQNGALQARLLKTSGAFHTKLMEPAKKELAAALDAMLPNMKPPTATVYMNATAEPCHVGTDPKIIVDLLKKQLTSPVLWEPSMRAMINAGVSEYFEVGPQKHLKAMMKRIDPKVFNSTTSLDI